tara:strand:- start:3583 stop:4152 length:570 start_codon:yes stop_codon:yes gene_type:complete
MFGVRVFDTVLNENHKDTVTRNAADFWKPFCQSAGWDFNYERVHSLQDLEYFLSRKIKEDTIIFSGHGEYDGFHLTNKSCFDGDNLKPLPEKNHGKLVIFSSCLIGKNEELAHSLKTYFKASALISYRELMMDQFCFLYESTLLSFIEHKLSKKKNNFTLNDFSEFQGYTEFMKNMNKENAKLHPMVWT